MDKQLVGNNVVILGNDFWTDDLSASIVAIDESKNSLLLKLRSKCVLGQKEYGYAIAIPRSPYEKMSFLLNNKNLTCNVTWVPNTEFNVKNPMDLSWWRGGGAAITDLKGS